MGIAQCTVSYTLSIEARTQSMDVQTSPSQTQSGGEGWTPTL